MMPARHGDRPEVCQIALDVTRFSLVVEGVGAVLLALIWLPRMPADEAQGHAVFLVGDATKREVLEEAGADGADVGIVAIGEPLGASILTLLAMRDVGIKATYVKVISEDHARIADALGATDTVFPERQAATNLASRITSGTLLHYTAYGEQFGIQEMAVPDSWPGKTLQDLKLPTQYEIQVVADAVRLAADRGFARAAREAHEGPLTTRVRDRRAGEPEQPGEADERRDAGDRG
jgi:trk system potassium uptake protein TrkA